MPCAPRGCLCPLLHRLVLRRRRCANDGTQPVLGAVQRVEILLKGGCPFRYLQNLLLLDAVRLAQLCRLGIVLISVHEGVDGEHDGCRKNNYRRTRTYGKQTQGAQGEADGARHVLCVVGELDFIAFFFVQVVLLMILRKH